MKAKLRIKKCRYCKLPFMPIRPLQQVCSPKCANSYANLKRAEKERKEWGKEKKERKERMKTLGDYEKEARRFYQKFIRLRDANEPCISCGCTTAKQWDAGHYFKAELFTGYIFTEPLCNKQCSRCNDLYSGNEIMYRIGLVKKIGEETVKEYEANMNNARVYKFTKPELIDIKEFYKNKIKELTN
jgi:hypothetical protein